MNKFVYLSVLCLVSTGLAACGSSGSSTTTSTTTSKTGLSLPTEISAVPTSGSGSSKAGVTKTGFKSKLDALRAAKDAGTDYSKTTTTTYVNEHTLEQFEIIEQVLGALAQTHYADESNVGAGPYKAMIAWQDEQNGVETKTLEPWIVQSDIITENGAEVTRARAWIEEVQDGGKKLIKAEFKIYAAATQDANGGYTNYGVWTLNVKFGDAATDYFAASASVGTNGESIIKLHERFPEGGEGGSFIMEVKAILNKSTASGFGKVSFPNWEGCTQHPCQPSIVEAKYAYNADHLAVQKAGEADPTFKDRNDITEMTHRYGMFDGATGANVFKSKSFGFPVFYTDSNGFRNYAYYGAWQGRHQLWGGGQNGGGITPGTTVTRDDRGENTTPQTYTVSEAFVGTLVKRSTVTGSLNDVLNIPVETWINKNYNIRWSGANSRWDACVNPSWGQGGQTCESTEDFTSILPLLEADSKNNRKHVNMNRWDQTANAGQGAPINYVYFSTDAAALAAGGSVAGFYVAEMDPQQPGRTVMLNPAELYTPSNGHDMWVNIGGSIYIEYTGTGTTGWVEKKLSKFDERTWTPEFDAAGDKPYTLPLNQELYINSRGTNYIVKRDNNGTTVKLEIQTVANPLNVSTFVPANTVFKSPWNPDNDSTYTFDTNASSATFMKLVYATIGTNDRDVNGNANAGVTVGGVVAHGQWGLAAHVNGVATETQYNWDYPREGENFGKITYLIDANSNYVLLSDPILLQPVTLTNNAGDEKTFSLQFDGWMHGLPDLFEEFRKKGFVMDTSISDKIVNIPAGTEVTDAADTTKTYLIKPLEISQFLNPVSDPGSLDITVADSVDLNSVPNFVEHNMGDMPTVSTVKYSEGILIE